MKNIVALLFLLVTLSVVSQTNTEVYLFDLVEKEQKTTLDNKRNISNNIGYDNQPSFINDSIVLFSSTRNNQTDIAAYLINDKKTQWISATPNGSEYSPTKIPGLNEISSIRLDKDGKQLLYRYDYKTGKSKVLLEDLKVGYHTWYNKDIIVSSVLKENALSLVLSNTKDKTTNTIQKNIGRSLHKIPNSNLISYISKEGTTWEIKSVNPITRTTKKIINTISESEDMCWLPDGTILMGKGTRIFKYNPKTDSDWSMFYSFIDKEIGTISRIATNPEGNMLAVVSDVSPEHIVQKQLEAYNSRKIDSFLSTYATNTSIYNYPDSLRYKGREEMRPYYAKKFKEQTNLHCEIRHRIVFGNKVIDEEYVTYNDKNVRVASIYEVKNEKIDKVTFIRPQQDIEEKNIKKIVQQQLDAYNARDINAFTNTFANDIKIYNFPNEFLYEGREKLKENYSDFFNTTPDLNCKINNRIVMGNKVIDEEFLTINGKNLNAVAIYEVKNGKISKVTFLK
ncbi:nuclear transport factor 2 family protein [Aquimarina sediminis]|uniref:nuclear transport factor 2 family protein n=1 Tax=Aquimarina sediminis TaxID=2070536 RepID=UPI0013E8EFBF|nr:nuclear transport factor 2 family protein [Aquimarina sediminis]